MSNSIYTIYCITNNVTEKQYIGQTTNMLSKRWKQHKKLPSDTHIYRSMKKHGIKNFSIEPIFHCKNKNLLDYLEKFTIQVYDTFHTGYNSTDGSSKSFKMSNYVREKISKSRKGIKLTEEHKNNISKSQIGVKRKPFSNTHKNNISKSKMGSKYNITYENKLNMSKKKKGQNSHWFNGFYKTPNGIFNNSYCIDNLSPVTLRNWCKNNNKKINIKSYNQSTYLQSLGDKDEIIGKTFKEIGFDFLLK